MSRRIARPYAAALFQVIQSRGLDAMREAEGQLAAIAEMFNAAPDLLHVFEVPTVATADKQGLLVTLTKAAQLTPEAGRLLAALAQHYRLRFLPQVVAAFRDLVDRREGKVRGRVVLANEVDAALVAKLTQALSEAVGRRVEIDSRMDPEILAGFVVQIGSRVFDGSVRTQIRKFAEQQ